MAFDLTNFEQYISRENDVLTKTLFMGGDTARFATYMGNVKGSTEVPTLAGEATIQAGYCKEPDGDVDADTVPLEVKPFTVFESFCVDDLQDKFPNMVLRPGSSNSEMPKSWEDAIIDLKASSINEQLELLYWLGDTAGTYTLFDGFVKKIDAAGTAIDGNPTSATAITLANVDTLVDGMRTVLPAKVKRSPDLVTLVGDDVFDLYIAKERQKNLYHYMPEHDNGIYKMSGSRGTLQRMYALDGTNRMFAGHGSRFVVGGDVKDEETVFDIFYDKVSDKVYLRAKGKAGVTVSYVDEIAEFTLSA